MTYVQTNYEHGCIVSPPEDSNCQQMEKYAAGRGFGKFVGREQASIEDEAQAVESPFWMVGFFPDHPRRLRYEHRQLLKSLLPRKTRSVVSHAMKKTQKRFLEYVRENKITGVRKAGCRSWRDFWRQVRHGRV